jgi:hypothetical protein
MWRDLGALIPIRPAYPLLGPNIRLSRSLTLSSACSRPSFSIRSSSRSAVIQDRCSRTSASSEGRSSGRQSVLFVGDDNMRARRRQYEKLDGGSPLSRQNSFIPLPARLERPHALRPFLGAPAARAAFNICYLTHRRDPLVEENRALLSGLVITYQAVPGGVLSQAHPGCRRRGG